MKKLKRFALGLTLALVYSTSSVFAYSNYYKHYRLEPNGKENHTGYHVKQTNERYVTNEVTKIENANSVDMWVSNDDGDRVSKRYNFKEELTQAMYHNKKKGDIISLFMRNVDKDDEETGFVWGWVNFR